MWRLPFNWILAEAQNAGLLVNPHRLDTVLHEPPPPPHPWTDAQHESLTLLWWPAEFFPKLRWSSRLGMRVPEIGLGRHRSIHNGALMHQSTLLRIRDTSYAPPNLSQAFRDRVRALPEVPAWLAYEG